MRTKNYFFFKLTLFVVAITNMNFSPDKKYLNKLSTAAAKNYYFSAAGNDDDDGSITRPFQTINKLNHLHLRAGDTVHFHGGDTFYGSILIDSSESGMKNLPIMIRTYGARNAVINSGSLTALTIYQTKYIYISNLTLTGSGRKNGNTRDGLLVMESDHITMDSLDITGFQKAGLLVYSSSQIDIMHVHAYENGYAGISIEGPYGKRDTKQIYIADCLAENNPGDPSALDNHSGNGIVVGHSSKVTIEYCVATNNGWDMPRIGNGPVGIWCYEADSITIQYCISYSNKTAKGADDGGGFDLDGGVSYSVIQHCLSYDNEGSGFGIFQYAGASPWHDNMIHDNVSENDGAVSAAQAAVYVWNSSGDQEQLASLEFYDNVVYNTKGAAIHYADKQNKREAFNFHNNIFVAMDEIIIGKVSDDIFSGNTWWSLVSEFNIDSTKDYKTWVVKTGKEQKGGKITGFNKKPRFKNAGNTRLTDPRKLKLLMTYQPPNSEE